MLLYNQDQSVSSNLTSEIHDETEFVLDASNAPANEVQIFTCESNEEESITEKRLFDNDKDNEEVNITGKRMIDDQSASFAPTSQFKKPKLAPTSCVPASAIKLVCIIIVHFSDFSLKFYIFF